MRLKTAKRWTQKRANRKVDMVLGRLEAYVSRHCRWTVSLGVGFAVNVVLILPFFAGMPWHRYWSNIGNILLFLCLLLFLAFISEAGWTLIQWQYLRELRRIELSYIKETRRVGDDEG